MISVNKNIFEKQNTAALGESPIRPNPMRVS